MGEDKKSVKKKVSQRCLQHRIYGKSSENMAKYSFTITITVNLHNLSLLHILEKKSMSLHKINETFSVLSFS